MKVLHVNNLAGVSVTLARYQRKMFIVADIITKMYDTDFGYSKIFPDLQYRSSQKPLRFIASVLVKALKYDVVHVHFNDRISRYLKKIYPRKTIILTYHGTDIRNQWDDRKKYYSNADLVTVATPDLLNGAPDSVVYIPNIVDEEHFQRKNPFIPNTMLYMHNGKKFQRSETEMNRIAKDFNSHLVLVDYRKQFIPYYVFPRYLELFEYVIADRPNPEKNTEWIESLSLIALQQLYMGGKVFYLGDVLDSFPIEHDAATVVKYWSEIYQGLC